MTTHSNNPPEEFQDVGPFHPKDITAFQRIVEEETGRKLSRHEAWEAASRVLALYRMLLGPMPEDPEAQTVPPPYEPPTPPLSQ